MQKKVDSGNVRILLAEDHKMFREALRMILEKEPDLHVVGEVSDGFELLQRVVEAKPDVVCMDISMVGLDGIEATRRLRQIDPTIKVIGLSAYSDKHFVLDMLHAGASGYVVKSEAGDELVRAIHSVRLGRNYLCPSVATLVTEALLNQPGADSQVPRISARERQVLQLIAEGCTSPQIATQLHLAPATVEVHRRNIMRKLNLHSVAELTKYAIRQGLTQG